MAAEQGADFFMTEDDQAFCAALTNNSSFEFPDTSMSTEQIAPVHHTTTDGPSISAPTTVAPADLHNNVAPSSMAPPHPAGFNASAQSITQPAQQYAPYAVPAPMYPLQPYDPYAQFGGQQYAEPASMHPLQPYFPYAQLGAQHTTAVAGPPMHHTTLGSYNTPHFPQATPTPSSFVMPPMDYGAYPPVNRASNNGRYNVPQTGLSSEGGKVATHRQTSNTKQPSRTKFPGMHSFRDLPDEDHAAPRQKQSTSQHPRGSTSTPQLSLDDTVPGAAHESEWGHRQPLNNNVQYGERAASSRGKEGAKGVKQGFNGARQQNTGYVEIQPKQVAPTTIHPQNTAGRPNAPRNTPSTTISNGSGSLSSTARVGAAKRNASMSKEALLAKEAKAAKRARKEKPVPLYTSAELQGLLTSDHLLITSLADAEDVAIHRVPLKLAKGVEDDLEVVEDDPEPWVLGLAERFRSEGSAGLPGPFAGNPVVQAKWTATEMMYKAKVEAILKPMLEPAKYIQARCWQAYEAALDAHKKGPWNVKDTVVTDGPDVELICSARLLAMGDHLEMSWLARHDLLEGLRVNLMAASPNGYLLRKVANMKSNKRRIYVKQDRKKKGGQGEAAGALVAAVEGVKKPRARKAGVGKKVQKRHDDEDESSLEEVDEQDLESGQSQDEHDDEDADMESADLPLPHKPAPKKQKPRAPAAKRTHNAIDIDDYDSDGFTLRPRKKFRGPPAAKKPKVTPATALDWTKPYSSKRDGERNGTLNARQTRSGATELLRGMRVMDASPPDFRE